MNLSGGTLTIGELDTFGNPASFVGNGTTTGWTGGTLNITSNLSASRVSSVFISTIVGKRSKPSVRHLCLRPASYLS